MYPDHWVEPTVHIHTHEIISELLLLLHYNNMVPIYPQNFVEFISTSKHGLLLRNVYGYFLQMKPTRHMRSRVKACGIILRLFNEDSNLCQCWPALINLYIQMKQFFSA